MKRLTTPRCLRTLTGLHDFGIIIAGLEFLHSMTDGTFFHVNRQRVGLARFSYYAKRLVLTAFFFIFGLAHAAPSVVGTSKVSTEQALVNHRVRTAPYEVRRADFRCPDLTAMMVVPQAGFGEQYVRCEDWDAFQQAMQAGDRAAAAQLVFGPKPMEGK